MTSQVSWTRSAPWADVVEQAVSGGDRNLWDSTDSWRTIYYRLVFAVDAKHRQRVFNSQRKLRLAHGYTSIKLEKHVGNITRESSGRLRTDDDRHVHGSATSSCTGPRSSVGWPVGRRRS